jgi:hypothetical protein
MFQWLLLAVAVTGIASLARGRGGDPTFFGAVAACAFIAGAAVARTLGPESVLSLFLPWAMVGIVALYVRFAVGAGKPKPDSMWSCPDCNMVNESNYVVCQACQRPWSPAA